MLTAKIRKALKDNSIDEGATSDKYKKKLGNLVDRKNDFSKLTDAGIEYEIEGNVVEIECSHDRFMEVMGRDADSYTDLIIKFDTDADEGCATKKRPAGYKKFLDECGKTEDTDESGAFNREVDERILGIIRKYKLDKVVGFTWDDEGAIEITTKKANKSDYPKIEKLAKEIESEIMVPCYTDID